MISLLLAIIYLAFISLGLPDCLLGAAWPLMHQEMGIPISYAGVLSMLIACGTVTSSLLSARLNSKLGTGLVTALSVTLTALALLGFSQATRFWMLCMLAIPYGLGAGSVDAALNNYVAQHYASRHMSWLHCMWGIGASIGPYIMGACLSAGKGWPAGYQSIGGLQILLSAILLLSLPLWRKSQQTQAAAPVEYIPLRQIFSIPGAGACILAFFCYCGAESTIFLWVSSYMVLHGQIPEDLAATYASLFFLGMTIGRALNGFLTIKWSDSVLIRLGSVIMFLGIGGLLLPFGQNITVISLFVLGLGCAPIYPCVIHSTPDVFGPEKSQALIGLQMAAAYLGALLMPPVFGLVANHLTISLFPAFLFVMTAAMLCTYLCMLRSVKNRPEVRYES